MKRKLTPMVDGLERRELLTVGFGRPHSVPVGAIVQQMAAGQQVTRAQSLNNYTPTQATTLTSPVVIGPGNPLPNELARTQFHAGFRTNASLASPRYSEQKNILYFIGTGSSTSFLHGSLQMAIVNYPDAAKPSTGLAYMQDKNLSGGNLLGLDLTMDPNSLDAKGRPTQGTFVADPNIYGGSFFNFQAAGTVKISYGARSANVVFNGNIYTNGLTNILRPVGIHVRK